MACDDLKKTDDLVARIAFNWFGLKELDAGEIRGLVLKCLEERPCAVLIDNFETLMMSDLGVERQASQQWLTELAGRKSIWLIVGVMGHNLPINISWRRWEPEKLQIEDARELFCMASGNPRHKKDQLIDNLLNDVDRVPHIIKILGHYASGYETLHFVRKLWDEKRTAVYPNRPDLSREESIVVAYEFAISQLSHDDLSALTLLSNLPSGMRAEDFHRLVREGLSADHNLYSAALLYHEQDPPRLRMLKPLRDHIETTRRTDHRSEAIVDHFLALALTGNHLDEATDPCIIYTLTAEYPNVCWAIQSALSDNFHDAVMAVIGLARFAVVTGSARVESGDLLIEARNKSRQMGEIQLEALCVRELGDIARSQDELHEQAIKHFEEAITLCELAGDQSSKGWCLKGLGDIFDNRDYKEAEKFYGLAIDCFQDCNDKRGLGWCYRGLAEIYRTVQIDLTKSEHYYRTALPLFQDCGVRRGEGWCVSGFGELAKLRKEDQTAKSYYDQATEIFQTCGDQRSEAWCRWCLGEIASSTSEAYLLYEEGRKMFQNAGAKRGEAWCLLGLGETDLRDEDLEQAREHLTSARTLFQTFGDTRGIDRCAEALSRLTNI